MALQVMNKNLKRIQNPVYYPSFEFFIKIVNRFQSLTIFTNSAIVDLSHCSEYASENYAVLNVVLYLFKVSYKGTRTKQIDSFVVLLTNFVQHSALI